MCGIAGAISLTKTALNLREPLQKALSLIAYRGPDDQGVWESPDRTALLGHRRLSILDLSPAGHQPMSAADGALQIVFNGEIYNFPEIRRELEKQGHTFRSKSDTEVLLKGYQVYGMDILQQLRGMFAFALYDQTKQRLFIARDRLGIKPLYYTIAEGTFYFGSEIKVLLEFPAVKKRLNLPALREYLAFGNVHAPATMFEGIYKLESGHYALIDAQNGFCSTKFWHIYQNQLAQSAANPGEAECQEKLRDLLRESVQLRMISDVPVGVFLSGGVDSTANVALMSQISGSRVNTFTAGFQGQENYDERKFARKAANFYHTNHHEIEISKSDLLETLPQLAFYLDEPIADATVIPIYFISQLARQNGAIVILNGDGADELLGGYRKWQKLLKIQGYWNIYQKFPTVVKQKLYAGSVNYSSNTILTDYLFRAAHNVEFFIGNTGALKGTRTFERLYQSGNGKNLYDAVKRTYREFVTLRPEASYVEWMSYWGLKSSVEHVFLYRADRMGMANSIEIRVPFLDHHLVEFAMQMPQHLKIKNGEPKYILKKALEELVPNEFLYRQKQGFCVPVQEWAGEMMREKAFAILPKMQQDWNAFGADVLRELESHVNSHLMNRNGFLTLNLYTLATWYQRWFM